MKGVFCLLFLSAVVFAEEYKITPFGVRRASCVLEVPDGATVTPHPGNNNLLHVSHRDGEYFHEVPAHCSDDIASLKASRKVRAAARNNATKPQEINGWLDYAGFYPSQGQNDLKSFTANYIVPGNPASVGNQVLFYFIGMENMDDPGAINILQPVLTWGNGYTQWYVASWACCPKNITVHSGYLFGLRPGSTVGGVVTRESASTWKIVSSFNGQETTLHAQVGDYNYNWADVTLEVYKVNTCSQFAAGKAYFNNLDLKDVQGQRLSPRWTFSPPTTCSGVIHQSSGDQITIQHSQ